MVRHIDELIQEQREKRGWFMGLFARAADGLARLRNGGPASEPRGFKRATLFYRTPPVGGTDTANPRGDHSDPIPMRPPDDPREYRGPWPLPPHAAPPPPPRPTIDPIPPPDGLVTLEAKLHEAEFALSLARRQLEAVREDRDVQQRQAKQFATVLLERRYEAQELRTKLDDTTAALTNALAALRLAVGGIRAMRTKGGSKLAKRLERALGE